MSRLPVRGGRAARLVQREAERVRALSAEAGHAGERAAYRDPFWPAQLTVAGAIVLYLTLPEKLTFGPTWLLPSAEGLLLVGLVVAMPNPAMQYSPARRHFAVTLISVVSLTYLVSLFLLV